MRRTARIVNAGFELPHCNDADTRPLRQIPLAPIEKTTRGSALLGGDHNRRVRELIVIINTVENG